MTLPLRETCTLLLLLYDGYSLYACARSSGGGEGIDAVRPPVMSIEPWRFTCTPLDDGGCGCSSKRSS
jgi:hypothetical protein